MSVNWLKVAQKMAEDARAQLAIDRQRLREIIEKRDKNGDRRSNYSTESKASSVTSNLASSTK
jgi:hypothetical protein